jgi:ATP-dependent Clp protease ATP-binding subunit ClpX
VQKKLELSRSICNWSRSNQKSNVAVYNHYKRLMQQQQDDEVEIEKVTSLVGQTGNR